MNEHGHLLQVNCHRGLSLGFGRVLQAAMKYEGQTYWRAVLLAAVPLVHRGLGAGLAGPVEEPMEVSAGRDGVYKERHAQQVLKRDRGKTANLGQSKTRGV